MAKQIVKALDGVPLAIEQARAVLREGISLDEFLEYYNSAYTELMSSKPARSAWYYDKNVSCPNVFKMTLSRLEGNQHALHLLNLVSCFGSRLLPVEYLTPASNLSSFAADESSTSDSDFLERLRMSNQRRDWLNSLRANQLGFRFAVSRLEALCLLKVRRNPDGSPKYISIHGSICRLRLKTLEDDSREDWVMLVACVLAQRVPDSGLETGSLLGLLPLVKHTTLLIKSFVSTEALEAPCGRLCHFYGFAAARFASIYLEAASTKEAEEMVTAAISYEMVSQQSLWPKDQRSLSLLRSMGMIYWKSGKLKDAAEVIEYLHESSENLLGPMNDMTIWAAARLRDLRDRKVVYSNHEVNAVLASNDMKVDSMSQTSPVNPGFTSTSEDPEIEIPDSEWSLIQSAEQSLEVFGEDNPETWEAMDNIAKYYRELALFPNAGAWYERLFYACSLTSLPPDFLGDALAMEALSSAVVCYGASSELSQKLKSFKGGLALAAGADRLDIVRKLLSAGADPKQRDKEGSTALHYAAKHANRSMVSGLLIAGADPKTRDKTGSTALHIAASQGDMSVVSDLLIAGVNPNCQDNSAETPLYLAVCEGHLESVKLLLLNGAEPNLPEAKGKRPLYIALTNDLPEIAELLLVAMNLIDDCKGPEAATILNEALLVSAIVGATTLSQELISRGANLQAETIAKRTPLHLAAYKGHASLVSTFLKYPIDVRARDVFGSEPLDLAVTNLYRGLHKWKSARFLLQHDALAEKRKFLRDESLRVALEGSWSGTREEDLGVGVSPEIAFTTRLESTPIGDYSPLWISRGKDSMGDFELYGLLGSDNNITMAQFYGRLGRSTYYVDFDPNTRTIKGIWEDGSERQSGAIILRKCGHVETIEESIVQQETYKRESRKLHSQSEPSTALYIVIA